MLYNITNLYKHEMKNKDFIDKYWQRAYRVAKFLQLAPFIKMIGVNGSLSSGRANKSSDIDFLIITKAGRIFTARFIVTFLTHLTGYRRHGNKVAGRICLNRYQTDELLEILPHDDYHSACFSKLVPILDYDNFYQKYQLANKWMEDFNYKIINKTDFKPIIISKTLVVLRNFFEFILGGKLGDLLERKLKKWQKKRIFNDPRTKKASIGRIRVSDQELCFHPEE